jgi:hypothetical protein
MELMMTQSMIADMDRTLELTEMKINYARNR